MSADEPQSANAVTGRVVGRVLSNKMDKSVTVAVERLVRHPVYGKFIRRTTKIMAHDQDNACRQGDRVALVECRPMSKRKAWRVVDVLESPARAAEAAAAAAASTGARTETQG